MGCINREEHNKILKQLRTYWTNTVINYELGYIAVREELYNFCNKKPVAAALLSYFENQHSLKYSDIDKSLLTFEDSLLYQPCTDSQLIAILLGMCQTSKTLRTNINFLVTKKVISLHQNPEDKFDRTTHYLFHPEVLYKWLTCNYVLPVKATEELMIK
jgi:hypothetical protein